jgi:hypothetical protein
VIPVNARLGIGFEQLHLVITDRRIIVAHRGKKGAGGLASLLIAGSHSGAFEDPGKPRIEHGTRKSFDGVIPEKVLLSDKDNFEIGYDELVRVEVDDGPDATGIVLLTGSDKFQFFTGLEAQEVVELIADHLGGRLVAKRTRS